MKTFRLGILALTLAASTAAAQDRRVITNTTIIDVERAQAIKGQSILIDNGKIAAIATGGAAAVLPANSGTAETIDGSKLFIIPGLFDSHVHYVDPESFGKLMIAHGVTFVRDLGADTSTIISVRDRLNTGELLGPEMICTGAIIDGNPPVWPFSEACDTPEEARAAVQKLKAAGVDQIKVYSKLKPDVYRAAVDEAKKLGLKPVGHIPTSVTPDEAREAGQTSVEHLSQFDRIVADLVPDESDKNRGTAIWAGFSAWDRMPRVDQSQLAARLKPFADAKMHMVPTLVVMSGIGRLADPEALKDPRLDLVPMDLRSFWAGDQYKGFGSWAAKAVPNMQTMVLAMHKAGVPLMVGTDLANPNIFAGLSVHDEMQLWAKAGIPAADILRSATIIPAKFMGVSTRLGTIEKGKAATFVCLSANPLDDIGNTLKIESVFQRGKCFPRSELDSLIKQVRDQVSASKPTANSVKLELPGQEIVRGHYTAKFGAFDAGTEDFLITKAADGYRVMAHTQPKGGMQKPSIITLHYGPDWSFTSATYKELVQSPIEATYTRVGKQIEVKAKKGDKELPGQTLPLPESFVFSSPINSGDFTVQAEKLEPGQTKETTAISFGYPDWKLTTTPQTITREEDGEVTRPDGSKLKARIHRFITKTPMGEFKGRSWSDDRGVILKSELVMPFGTVTAELK